MLCGGAGIDTYVIGSGTDTIVDEDGQGIIMDAAGNRIEGLFVKNSRQCRCSADPQIVASRGTSLEITLANGAKIVIDDFHEGDLGIRLTDMGMVTAPPKVIELSADGDMYFYAALEPIA